VKRHVKASSAGSTAGQSARLGGLRLVLLAFCTAAVFSASVSNAAAVVQVTLVGNGAGTVTSDKGSPPINCSISGGTVSGTCSAEPPVDFSFLPTTMTATPAPGSVFAGWTVGENGCMGTSTPCDLLFPSFGLSYSLTASFEPPPPPPVSTTEGTGEVNYYYAGLEGRVNPGGNKVDSCFFEYGETTAYGETTPCLPASIGSGTSDIPVSAQTSQLEPSTTYHYRLVATNLGGPGNGDDRTFTTTTAPADNCPNAAIRAEQGGRALMLPDCMAYEQVSPPQKAQAVAVQPLFSANGERVIFVSGAAIGDPPGLPGFLKYITTRGPSGWGTPVAALAPKEYCCGNPGEDGQGVAFAPDLSRWANIPATAAQTSRGIGQVFSEAIDGSRVALSPLFQGTSPNQSFVKGTSADMSHVYVTKTLVSDEIYDAHLDSGGVPTLPLFADLKKMQRSLNSGAAVPAHLGGTTEEMAQ